MNLGKVVGYQKGRSPRYLSIRHTFSLENELTKIDRGMVENVEKLVKNPSVSVGLGLMYRYVIFIPASRDSQLMPRLDPIRIEVNFSMPLIARKGERLARGFGIGVGLEFL
jgi:outer membrane protein insertion porin family